MADERHSQHHHPVWDVQELTRCILSRLPPSTLLRARLVCTSWRRAAQTCHGLPGAPPCCYLVGAGAPTAAGAAAHMFDPGAWAWRRVTAPAPSVPGAPLRLVRSAASGGATLGLVAFQEPPVCRGATKKLDDRYGLHRPPPAPRFWVGNPVTNRWKFIPGAKGVPGGRAHYEFVVVDGAGYRIVAVAMGGGGGGVCGGGGGGTGPVVAVYDSRTEEWRLGPRVWPEVSPPLAGGAGGGGESGEEVVLAGAREGSVWVVSLDRAARVVRYRAGGVSGAGNGERVEVVVEAADRVAGQDGGVLVSPWVMLFGGAPAAAAAGVPVPVVAAVAPAWSGSGGVHVYEFVERRGRGGGGGWVLETSSRLGGLKALFGKLASDGGGRGGGGAMADCGAADAVAAGSEAVLLPPAWARGGTQDEPAEVLYLSYAGSRQAMYNVGKDEFALLPEHSRDAACGGHGESSCAFYPRFDMQP